MKLAQVVGHDHEKAYLQKVVAQHNIPQSLFLVCKEGVGGLQLAIAFAQYINCENPIDGDACGECNSCFKINNIGHPDIHYTYPVFKADTSQPLSIDFIKQWQTFLKNEPYGNVYDWLQFLGAKNKQGNIYAQECQYIIQKLVLKSYEAQYKVQIIWMPEFLKEEGNKLLKLIEEPPSKTVFIFIAENPNAVLDTILSRSQILYLKPLKAAHIEQYLLQSGQYSGAQINAVLPFCEGNMRRTLILLEEDLSDNEDLFLKLIQCVHTRRTTDINEWVQGVSKNGREFIKQFFIYALDCLHHSLRTTATQQVPSSRIFGAISTHFSVAAIIEMRPLFEHTIYYIERNANEPLTLHALIVQLIYLIHKKQLVRIL